MKNLSSKLIYFIVPLLLVTAAFLLVGSTNSKDNGQLRKMGENISKISLNPPDNLNFAGEVCPIWDFDVKERFDHELVRNVFFHSSTIMTMKRAARYQDEIVSILNKKGIPEDFFYLCLAESQLTNATSGAGAKGFWQFMKETGTAYNLEISDQVDERYNHIKATHAATSYLRDAYKKFGNWTLVAASYNMGMGGVEEALKKQQVSSYYDLYLNAETRAYVFRILALKSVMTQPGNYGFELEESNLYKPLAFKSVVVTQDVPDLVAFAKENGSNYKLLKVMNPWLLKDHLKVAPGKSYTIRIPLNEDFSANELIAEEKADSVLSEEVKVLTKRDTLSPKIAK